MLSRVERALVPAIVVVLALGLIAGGLVPFPVAFLSIPFLVVLARQPILRRLAVRNALRRPRETALIIVGAMLGTAIITGSAVVGDTLRESLRRTVYTTLGPIDELVFVSGLERRAALEEAVASVRTPDIDGTLPLTFLNAGIASIGPEPKGEPRGSVIEIDFDKARALGGDPDATGIEGPTPTGDRVVIGEDLAKAIDVEAGQQIELYAYGTKRAFTIDRVLDKVGIAGLSFAFGNQSSTVFAPIGTIESLAASGGQGAPPSAAVAVSNRGGVIEGADRSAKVTKLLDEAVASVPAQTRDVKRQRLEISKEAGDQFTQLFTSIGFFSVIAGILLLVAIFVMLAEERKTELGMLRAVGLRRWGLIRFFSLEGWMYAIAASAAGTLVGLGLGRLIVVGVAAIFANDGPFALDLRYSARLTSVQRSFTTGFVMALLTVLGTAFFNSRLNVIRAIRDLPDPPRLRARLVWTVVGFVLGVLGALQTLGGFAQEDPAALLVGPTLVGLGAAMVLRRLLPRRLVYTVCAGGVLLWTVLAFDIAGEAFDNPDISLFVVSGVILTLSAIAIVSQHQEGIGHLVRRLGRDRSVTLRLGLAYPLARAFRTGLILTNFALVMYTLTSITLFSGVFRGQIDQFERDVSGGFDLRIWSVASNPVPPEAISGRPDVAAVVGISNVGAEFKGGEETDFTGWGVGGIDEAFVNQGPPSLGEYDRKRFKTEADVFRALLADPNAIIVDEFFLQNGGGPPEGLVDLGDKITMRDPATGATKEITVIGLADAGFGDSPAYMGANSVQEFFGARAVKNQLLLATKPGVDPQDVAERINAEFIPNGADAMSFRKLVGQALAQQNSFFRLMQAYLALGLVVGVAGLGVIMVRAVRERRREIGVLRSLGFEVNSVRRAFVTESSFVALEGILIGAALALVSTWRLLTSGAFGEDLSFTVPWVQVGLVVGLAFVSTVVATAAPAQQASRIRPAVALRIAD